MSRKHPLLPCYLVALLALVLIAVPEWGGRSISSASARPAPAPSSESPLSQMPALGPLEFFPGLTDSDLAATAPADSEQVGARDEGVLIGLVREKMRPLDRAALDQLLAVQRVQEQDVQYVQGLLDGVQNEIDRMADAYLLQTATTPGVEDDGVSLSREGGAPRPTLLRVWPNWIFPVAGPHSFGDTFGAPRYSGGYHPHRGNDIFCKRGTPLVAVVPGIITRANPLDIGLGGRTIWLWGDDGNGYYYAHLESIAAGIHSGDRVAGGQVIGYAGNSGNARTTPVHLHFEIHPGNGPAIDPYLILKGAATIDQVVASTTTSTRPTTTTTTTTTVPTATTTTTTTTAPTSMTTTTTTRPTNNTSTTAGPTTTRSTTTTQSPTTTSSTTTTSPSTTSSTEPSVKPIRYEESDPRLAYSGEWGGVASGSASAGSYAQTSSGQSSITITFNGTYLGWIGTQGSAFGTAFVSVDGGEPLGIDLAASSAAYERVVWNSGRLEPGEHTVSIWRDAGNRVGAFINLDAVEVVGTLVQAATPPGPPFTLTTTATR